MKIDNFKKFENNPHITTDEIKELFFDLTDIGYKISIYTNSDYGNHFFDVRKTYNNDDLGYVEQGNYYGYTNIKYIQSEINKVLEIIDRIKEELKSRGYLIAYEMDLNYSIESRVVIVCHMSHEDQIRRSNSKKT